MTAVEDGWYFTAPWDPVPIRRGDALGFRAGADYFAELLAPGLSNGTSDARWISLLSWCLKWSHVAWQNAGQGDLSRRDDQRQRYAWLRPLELLWVARALESGQTTGQLRGRRAVKRWLDALDEGEKLPNFAMSPDQFRRYRQVGTYGVYRVVLRSIPGLTTGDGWTPDRTALELADLVNDSLGTARLKQEQFEDGTKWGSWIGDEARYWRKRGWPSALEKLDGLLPTPDAAASKRLPSDERSLLEPKLFGAESTRRITAEVLANARGAKSHADLSDALAASDALAKKLGAETLAPLPAFSRFADAAMHTMRGLWNEINGDGEKQAPTTQKLAQSTELQSRFDRLREQGNVWLRAPGRATFPHERVSRSSRSSHGSATSPQSSESNTRAPRTRACASRLHG